MCVLGIHCVTQARMPGLWCVCVCVRVCARTHAHLCCVHASAKQGIDELPLSLAPNPMHLHTWHCSDCASGKRPQHPRTWPIAQPTSTTTGMAKSAICVCVFVCSCVCFVCLCLRAQQDGVKQRDAIRRRGCGRAHAEWRCALHRVAERAACLRVRGGTQQQ